MVLQTPVERGAARLGEVVDSFIQSHKLFKHGPAVVPRICSCSSQGQHKLRICSSHKAWFGCREVSIACKRPNCFAPALSGLNPSAAL